MPSLSSNAQFDQYGFDMHTRDLERLWLMLDATSNSPVTPGPAGADGSAGDSGPAGADGAAGAAATVTIGTTTTGAAGSSATVVNSGSTSAAVLDFTIPKGDTGATGPTGATGLPSSNGWTAITATGTTVITVPAGKTIAYVNLIGAGGTGGKPFTTTSTDTYAVVGGAGGNVTVTVTPGDVTGGSAACILVTFPVVAGDTLTLVVGAKGGTTNLAAGGTSTVTQAGSGTAFASAAGGNSSGASWYGADAYGSNCRIVYAVNGLTYKQASSFIGTAGNSVTLPGPPAVGARFASVGFVGYGKGGDSNAGMGAPYQRGENGLAEYLFA